MLRPQNCRSTAFHNHPLGKLSQTHVKDELESDHYLHLQRYKSTRMILRKRLPIAISLQSAISPLPLYHKNNLRCRPRIDASDKDPPIVIL